MSNSQHTHHTEDEACSSRSQTERTISSPGHNVSSDQSSSLRVMAEAGFDEIVAQSSDTGNVWCSFNSVEMVIRFLSMAAEGRSQCAKVLSFTRTCLRFDFILFELGLEFPVKTRFKDRVAHHFLPAVRNVLEVAEGLAPNEAIVTFSEITDPVCQFLCCSMLFVDANRDTFFKALDLDLLKRFLPRSFSHILKIISFIRPPVQSLRMSPIGEGLFPMILDPLANMLSALSPSLRQLTAYLPDDQIVQVLQNARFSLEALEELRFVLRGERVRQYNPPEASNAMHGFLEKVGSMCPRLKHLLWENMGLGNTAAVNIRWLPASVKHMVIIRDINVLGSFHSCVGLRTITIHAANIDFDRFVLFEYDDGFPQLERINFVNCSFNPSPAELVNVSKRMRSCVRTIMNDPLKAVPFFPVERLPVLMYDLPSLEVVELHLNTEADKYICELLGNMVEKLEHLKSFTVRVIDTILCDGNANSFNQMFQCLIESKNELEHLCMPNIWVCIELLFQYLKQKGKDLKTLDVKAHSTSFANGGVGGVLSSTDICMAFNCVRMFCPAISNVSLGERQCLAQILGTEQTLFGGCKMLDDDICAKGILDVVTSFDRFKVGWEVYQDGLRGVCDSAA
ncbi:unnamed protein product [Agarophyton chilense]